MSDANVIRSVDLGYRTGRNGENLRKKRKRFLAEADALGNCREAFKNGTISTSRGWALPSSNPYTRKLN